MDGKVMSLSVAAVHCMQKAGSQRETANGWIMWKTLDGTYLNDFYNQVYSAQDGDSEESTVRQASAVDAPTEPPSPCGSAT